MHLEQTLHQMRQMRLSYMARSLEERLNNGDNHDLSHEEFISLLIEDEFNARKNRKLTRMLGRANFKANQACIENRAVSADGGAAAADLRHPGACHMGHAAKLLEGPVRGALIPCHPDCRRVPLGGEPP